MQAHSGLRALVLTTEPMTAAQYRGKSRSMLIAHALLRLGGAAVLLSSRAEDRRRAKCVSYLHCVSAQPVQHQHSPLLRALIHCHLQACDHSLCLRHDPTTLRIGAAQSMNYICTALFAQHLLHVYPCHGKAAWLGSEVLIMRYSISHDSAALKTGSALICAT
jgi:hypothetical protein